MKTGASVFDSGFRILRSTIPNCPSHVRFVQGVAIPNNKLSDTNNLIQECIVRIHGERFINIQVSRDWSTTKHCNRTWRWICWSP